MKRILFVTSALGIGGMERVLVDIANALVERNYDVTILTYINVEGESWIVDLDERVHFIYKKNRDFPIREKLPYIHRYYKKNKLMWETRASAKELYKYYVGNKCRYDVEIAFCRGMAVKIVSGSTNKKSVKLNWIHNDYTLVDPKTITASFNNMEEAKEAYKVFDKIVAVSNQAKEKFIEVIGYKEKVVTIYNMLPIQAILSKSEKPCPVEKCRFTVISVARLIPAKGYDTLLRAVKRLVNDGYDFDLWLVGRDFGTEYNLSLRDYVSKNHLENVKFLGNQMNPYCFMKQADLYICSSWREGFSISVAEAMCCGLPVISTNCTGPTEILDNGKYGILINYDEDEMYFALKRVLDNPDILDVYKEKSLYRSKCFSSEIIIKEIIGLF